MPVTKRGREYYTVTELSEELGVHRNTVIYWIKKNQVKAERVGMAPKSPLMIPLEEAERVIEEYTNPV